MNFLKSLFVGLVICIALLLLGATAVVLLPIIIVLVIVALILDGLWRICVDHVSLNFFVQRRGGVYIPARALSAATESASRNLVVYFHGIVADGIGPVEEVLEGWRERGDVRVIGYRRPSGKGSARFDGTYVSERVAWAIASEWSIDYDTITLYGGSMGGGIAADVVATIRTYPTANQVTPKLRIIVQDAPTKRKDFQSPLDKLSWWLQGLPLGSIANLLSGPVMSALFVGPKEENIEEDVDKERLECRVKAAQKFPLSFHRDQTMAMIRRKPLERGCVADIPLVYIRSTRDTDTVRKSAAIAWCDASTYAHQKRPINWRYYVECDSTHLGIGERPLANILAFNEAGDLLGLPT